jgi:hypothetical protein
VSDAFIAIALFASCTYIVKLVLDARMRRQALEAGATEELIRAFLAAEERHRQRASLRLALILLSLGAGFGLIEFYGWNEVTPGAIAVIAASTGFASLGYFFISRRLS